MSFDFKKEYKEFYLPKNKPEIVDVPKANYIAIRGKGNPNDQDGDYQKAIGVLYSIAYTLKMSYKTDYKIEGFFDYVVPPLEGFWWQDGIDGVDYTNKELFNWISIIRLPDFITKKDFAWAKETVAIKKKIDCSKAEFLTIKEGLCVQIMHHGSYDDEPATVAIMDKYLEDNGYENDFSDTRLHHEIYLSDARKVAPDKLKTVIRHPIKKG
ncbi:MAG: GyrI-like domain-containing protein [Firmicutes bacterium]|nr:GyrI-like domain-containing protein [Candidatus Colivicinus equi]